MTLNDQYSTLSAEKKVSSSTWVTWLLEMDIFLTYIPLSFRGVSKRETEIERTILAFFYSNQQRTLVNFDWVQARMFRLMKLFPPEFTCTLNVFVSSQSMPKR